MEDPLTLPKYSPIRRLLKPSAVDKKSQICSAVSVISPFSIKYAIPSLGFTLNLLMPLSMVFCRNKTERGQRGALEHALEKVKDCSIEDTSRFLELPQDDVDTTSPRPVPSPALPQLTPAAALVVVIAVNSKMDDTCLGTTYKLCFGP